MNERKIILPKSEDTLISTRQEAISVAQYGGSNQLVSAALPLLLLMIQFKQMETILDQQITVLRDQVIDEIIAFAENARKLQYSPRIILAARYCLCTALDEAALSTHWGNQSQWPHHTLLSIMQKETWGGERFFLILEEMAKLPAENLDLLELLYLLLSLGFEGKYYDQDQAVRDEARHRLYRLIRLHKPQPDKTSSSMLPALQQSEVRKKFFRWKMAGISLLIFSVMWIAFNMLTWFSSRDILHTFSAPTRGEGKHSAIPALDISFKTVSY